MAATQLARGALDSPWPQASWTSVARRSLVVSGFLAYGLFTNNLDTAAFAAFGALQIGLGEVAAPFRVLLRFVILSTAATGAAAFVAMSLGGTWWTVAFLAALAFAQGSSVSAGVIPRGVGIGALAMAVIFAGLHSDPLTASTWLVIGCLAQSAVWLVLWRRERTLSVRQALRNSVASVTMMVRRETVSGAASNIASAVADEAKRTIIESGVPNQHAALRVVEATSDVRRNVVAWRQLSRPGLSERLRVAHRLQNATRTLGEMPDPHIDGSTLDSAVELWAAGHQLDGRIRALEVAIDQLPDKDRSPVDQARPSSNPWAGLHAGSVAFTHGVRMASAIAIAQSLSLLLPLNHSFWIPLTCVFVVKPDWAFTVIRAAARIGGNLLAILLIPAALFAAGASPLAVALTVLVTSAVAFRFFTGNYILGSFGIAGTVLVLDQLLDPTASLYVSRIISTLIGAVVAIAVSAIIPAWRGSHAIKLLDDVVAGLAQWSHLVTQGLMRPAELDTRLLDEVDDRERGNLIQMRPAAESALLEPKPVADPRCLAVIVDAATRAHLSLLALGFQATVRKQEQAHGLDIARSAQATEQSFARAAATLSIDVGIPKDEPVPAVVEPQSDEEIAVAVQAIRLEQAAADLADAVGLLVAGQVTSK